MKITEKILLVILVGFLTISLVKCDQRNKKIESLTIENQGLKETTNQLNQVIEMQQVEVVKSSIALKTATDSFFNLRKKDDKKIKDALAFYKAHTKIIIDTTLVPYIDSGFTKKWTDSVLTDCANVISYYDQNSIKVPRTAVDSTKDYKVSLTADLKGIRINTLQITDTQYIRFVTIKGGILKKDQSGKRHLFLKKSVRVDVLHTNSLIHIDGQSSIIYQPPNRPHALIKGIIFGAGIFLGTKL